MASPSSPNLKPEFPLETPRQPIHGLQLPSYDILQALNKHIYIPYNSSSPAGLIEADTVDPWTSSGKYALGFVYFAVVLLVLTAAKRVYYLWKDKLRVAVHEGETEKLHDEARQAQDVMATSPRSTGLSLQSLGSKASIEKVEREEGVESQPQKSIQHQQPWLERAFHISIALIRFLVYRPLPDIVLRRNWRPIIFPSLPAALIIFSATLFVTLYCFIPQPLYWSNIAYGSPPLAIRAGMLAVALLPWILALSMKANLISMITGIGHERLNVLHRWAGWLCVFLSLVHTIPFYVTPIWEGSASEMVFASFFGKGIYIYGSGIAALVPLLFLSIHSLPPLRHYFHRTFLILHIPVSFALLALLFWHVRTNLPSMTLTSYAYLLSTLGILATSYAIRLLFFLNFTNPWRLAWLVGDEAHVSLLHGDAVRITITTRMKWRAGQYAYLRLPSVSLLVSHPFTITSLCTPGLPENVYAPPRMAEGYREMTFLIRPSSSYAQRLLATAAAQEPGDSFRAFLDGPYGGMSRALVSFDHVLLIAGGSGITALMSQLVGLIKAISDGRAVTKSIRVVWAVKRAESLAWFADDLRVYMDAVGGGVLRCSFYVTGARRERDGQEIERGVAPSGPIGVQSGPRTEMCTRAETDDVGAFDKELCIENEDAIAPLPQAHIKPLEGGGAGRTTLQQKRGGKQHLTVAVHTTSAPAIQPQYYQYYPHSYPQYQHEQQQRICPSQIPPLFSHGPNPRSPFLHSASTAHRPIDSRNWTTEHGRPDIPFLLRDEWTREFGQRNCVFVCGPPGMRRDVANGVAEAQRWVWQSMGRRSAAEEAAGEWKVRVQEVWLHAENFAL